MADVLFRHESPQEFFKQQVEGAMRRQHLQASDWTVYYIVSLLASFVTRCRPGEPPDAAELPLAVRLTRALAADGGPSRDSLRHVADHALFLAGFFGDSLQRRAVDIDYYISVGGFAYRRLAGNDDDAFADVFGELAAKFIPVVDVLAEISDRSLRSNRDILRVYERWLRTGSRRDQAMLAERGLTAPGSRRVQ
jgi:hypothetical protein